MSVQSRQHLERRLDGAFWNVEIDAERRSYSKAASGRRTEIEASRKLDRHAEARLQHIEHALNQRPQGRDYELRHIEDTYHPEEVRHAIHLRPDRRH